MQRRKWRVPGVLLLTLVLLVVAAGCGGGQQAQPAQAPAQSAPSAPQAPAASPPAAAPAKAPAAAPAPAAPVQIEKVKFVIPAISNSFLPVRVAVVKDLFKPEGLDPEIIQMGGSPATQALHGKQVDYNGAWGSSMRAALTGLPLKGVMMTWRQTFEAAYARPQFKTAADLKGRIVGISGPGGLGDSSCRMMLEKFGVDVKTVQIMNFSDDPEVLMAMIANRVDASCFSPPHMFKAQEQGMNRLIELSEVVKLPLFGGLAVHDDTLKAKPDQVKRMIRAHLRALQFIKNNKAETLKIMMDWLKIDQANAELNWALIERGLAFDGFPAKGSIELMLELEKKNIKSEKDIPISQFMNLSLLRQAVEELKVPPDPGTDTYS